MKEQFHCAIYLLYAPNDHQGRLQVWNQVRSMKIYIHVPLLLIGDFNEVLVSSERRGAVQNTASMRDLQKLVQDL